ncbi:Pantothenate transporter FEN2 [Lasiodiplodia hormozganensis]|uniref:Pantothenate transporter FEN2 n=1 Tax=Lasiodiplodia hormozganensis TaxID=869390 RepID=A0AA40CL16_9PEZI|nr:Pantothenate transporter FEN2 [Lasiodiplodia hormozganensis]
MKFFSRPAVLAAKEPRSPAERDLVRRLDIFLMTFGCISQIIKYLDQMNINNAYVSGMKEDLELYGNELNYFQTYFNVAYCIMLIPSQVIMTYVRPSLWLSSLEIAWGVMTGLMAMVTKTYQVYIIRYTPMELAKRMGFYHSCQAVGSMMSGALQAAIMDTLHGHHGLTGWRWLFVINAVITGVWGFLGFFLLPDYPNNPNPRAFWFRKTHGEMAMTRLTRHKRAEPEKLSWAGAKRTFNSWIVYFIATLYVATVLTTNGNSFFSLFLKAMKNPDGSARWTTVQVNAIPIGGSAINVVFVWIWAILSDVFQTRWILIIAQDKKGWQLSIGLWILVIAMTSTLRFIDIRYLKPKREAHAETIEGQVVEEEVNVERESIKTKGVDAGV